MSNERPLDILNDQTPAAIGLGIGAKKYLEDKLEGVVLFTVQSRWAPAVSDPELIELDARLYQMLLDADSKSTDIPIHLYLEAKAITERRIHYPLILNALNCGLSAGIDLHELEAEANRVLRLISRHINGMVSPLLATSARAWVKEDLQRAEIRALYYLKECSWRKGNLKKAIDYSQKVIKRIQKLGELSSIDDRIILVDSFYDSANFLLLSAYEQFEKATMADHELLMDFDEIVQPRFFPREGEYPELKNLKDQLRKREKRK